MTTPNPITAMRLSVVRTYFETGRIVEENMASFLSHLKTFGLDVAHVGLGIFNTAAPVVLPIVGTAVGGPLGASIATALVQSVINAEKAHQAKAVGAPDTRKQEVTDNFTAFLPVIEALAAALGHPITDTAALEAQLPKIIDGVVAGLNSMGAFAPKPVVPAT